jgi:hypothetical protein
MSGQVFPYATPRARVLRPVEPPPPEVEALIEPYRLLLLISVLGMSVCAALGIGLEFGLCLSLRSHFPWFLPAVWLGLRLLALPAMQWWFKQIARGRGDANLVGLMLLQAVCLPVLAVPLFNFAACTVSVFAVAARKTEMMSWLARQEDPWASVDPKIYNRLRARWRSVLPPLLLGGGVALHLICILSMVGALIIATATTVIVPLVR